MPIGLTSERAALARGLRVRGLADAGTRRRAASTTSASRCGRTTHINHAPGTPTSTPRNSLPLKRCAVPSAALPIAELHQRFLADRRRPEEDARHEEDEEEVQALVEERHRLARGAVPEVRADERDQPEHDEAGDHVGAEEVVHDAGEPSAGSCSCGCCRAAGTTLRGAEPEAGVPPAVHVEHGRVADVAVGVHERAVAQDRRELLRPSPRRRASCPSHGSSGCLRREPARCRDRGEHAEDRHEHPRDEHRRRREERELAIMIANTHRRDHRERHPAPIAARCDRLRRRRTRRSGGACSLPAAVGPCAAAVAVPVAVPAVAVAVAARRPRSRRAPALRRGRRVPPTTDRPGAAHRRDAIPPIVNGGRRGVAAHAGARTRDRRHRARRGPQSDPDGLTARPSPRRTA